MLKSWVSDLNTTNFRIVWSVLLAAFVTVFLTFAMVVWGWEPKPMQFKILVGIAGGLLTMMGFDVIQFASKRFSNSEYAAAKNQPKVTVEAPSTVTVTDDSDKDPVIVGPKNKEKELDEGD